MGVEPVDQPVIPEVTGPASLAEIKDSVEGVGPGTMGTEHKGVGVVSSEPVNMASAAPSPYERNKEGQIIVPDDDARIVDGWYRKVGQINDLAGALAFFADLTKNYQHSYNSFIQAVSAFSVLAGKLMNVSGQGPADDFQRQMIGFTLLRLWHDIPADEPIKMFRFNDLLHQSAANVMTFRMLDGYQSNWLRRKALEKLMNTPSARLHPDVRNYLRRISAGGVPDGFTTMAPQPKPDPSVDRKE